MATTTSSGADILETFNSRREDQKLNKERLKGKVVKVSEKSIVKGNWTNDRVACPSYQEASAAILH